MVKFNIESSPKLSTKPYMALKLRKTENPTENDGAVNCQQIKGWSSHFIFIFTFTFTFRTNDNAIISQPLSTVL